MDLGNVIVHIMQPAIRDYYNLEELWGGKLRAASRSCAAAPTSRHDRRLGRTLTKHGIPPARASLDRMKLIVWLSVTVCRRG